MFFFSWSVDLAAQYAQSPLTLDHFRQYSRQTSPQRHFSLDPRSTLHTAVNTPDISPDRSAASTPGLASGAHGSHAGSTRKAKYTRSRTGCLGCRVKRVKCDEGRPECKRCVNAKRGVSRRSLIVVLLYVTKTDALLFSPRAYLLDKFGIASASILHCKICRKRLSERWLRRRGRIRGIRRATTRFRAIGNELGFQGKPLVKCSSPWR